MSDQFLGEIRGFAGNFAMVGWALCNGQTLPISQYAALFSLLGTQYGGNGTSNFQLPNLQGNIAVGAGQGNGLSLYVVGETGGETAVTLLQSEMPQHTHNPRASTLDGNQPSPNGNSIAKLPANEKQFAPYNSANTNGPYGTGAGPTGGSITGSQGGNLQHNNMQPVLAITYLIAMQGIFPARN